MMSRDKVNLGVVGCGNMASAILEGLKDKKFNISLFDKDKEKLKTLGDGLGCQLINNLSDFKKCNYILLAVKPQNLEEISFNLKENISKDVVLVSILAGVTTEKIEEAFGIKKIIRVMPNTPALVNHGVTLFYSNKNVSNEEIGIVKGIFSSISKVFVLSLEDDIDKVTGVSGSGPALIFEYALSYIEKLKNMGFDEKLAEKIVKETFLGSSILMNESKDSILKLRDKVTSKGGVTFEALKVLSEGNLPELVSNAVDAAYKRSKEL